MSRQACNERGGWPDVASSMDTKVAGGVAVDAVDFAGTRSGHRIYEVDGLMFRVDVTRPTAAAEALRDGSWRAFCLTSADVQALLGARELSPEEAYLLEDSASGR